MAKEEKQESQVVKKIKKQKRTPASTPPVKRITEKRKVIKREGRKLIGLNARDFSDPNNDLVMINKVSKDWDKKLSRHYKRTVDKKIDVKIEKLDSMIVVQRNGGRYSEHVLVTLTKPNGEISSFNAHIDSETGAIIQTWNRVRRHHYGEGSEFALKLPSAYR